MTAPVMPTSFTQAAAESAIGPAAAKTDRKGERMQVEWKSARFKAGEKSITWKNVKTLILNPQLQTIELTTENGQVEEYNMADWADADKIIITGK